jgi:hypothetical protein
VNLSIIVGGVIWLGASIASSAMQARAWRFLTPEQQTEVESLRAEMWLFAHFLWLDLWILFILIALLWSNATMPVSIAFMVAIVGVMMVRDAAMVRRVQPLGLPRQYTRAVQRAPLLRYAALCALFFYGRLGTK